MNNLLPLMRREWLQHRLGWTLVALLPTLVVMLVVGLGDIHFDEAPPEQIGLPAALALGALAGSAVLHLVLLWITSLIIVSGLARRDHNDRSVEFWLSLPVSHARSFAVPLGVHLLLVPLAALAIGLASGLVVSFVLVSRVAGAAEWLALPWGGLLLAALVIVARLALGVLLATLWLSPLILAVVLLTAWFRFWGIVILAAGIGVGSAVADKVFGQPLPSDLLAGLFERAGRSIVNAGEQNLVVDRVEDLNTALGLVPGWAANDAVLALGLLPSPWLPGALLVAAACFWGLVRWRRGGAGV